MNAQELGRQVLKRRTELKMSQNMLAQQADISRNYVSLIERGEATNVSINVLNRLAGALGTTPSELTSQAGRDETLISPVLRQFGLEHNLSFDIVDRLSRIPRRGQEPRTVEEWEELYKAIRPYLE